MPPCLSVPITTLSDGSVGCTQTAVSSAASPAWGTGVVSTTGATEASNLRDSNDSATRRAARVFTLLSAGKWRRRGVRQRIPRRAGDESHGAPNECGTTVLL